MLKLDKIDNELEAILGEEKEIEEEAKVIEEKEISADNAKDRKIIERARWKKEKEARKY